ncbi:MAG: c-type cytochrome [Methylobacillus sp.]|jgi:cytochrome c553|nr:c-type cytochrome [Methylobacillus sp.]
MNRHFFAAAWLCLFYGTGASPALADESADTSHLRVLAGSCAACHGTNGNSVGGTPVLAGLTPAYFIARMQAFRAGKLDSTVMHHHAQGLTEDEITLLADYFSRQARVTSRAPTAENH